MSCISCCHLWNRWVDATCRKEKAFEKCTCKKCPRNSTFQSMKGDYLSPHICMMKYCTLLIVNASLFFMLLHYIRFLYIPNECKGFTSTFLSLLLQRLSLRSTTSICIGIDSLQYWASPKSFKRLEDCQFQSAFYPLLIAVMILFLIGQPVQFLCWVLYYGFPCYQIYFFPKLVKLCNP